MVPQEWLDKWVLLAEELLSTPPNWPEDAHDLRAAAAARELAERGPSWRRVEAEARLLAGESTEAIAAKAGLAPATVEAYTALHYAVTDRLRHPGYITHFAIRLYSPGVETDVGAHVRMLGFQGGPLVLDAVLNALVPGRSGAEGSETSEDRRVRKLARLAVGLRMTPVTAENATRWAGLYALMRECRALGVKLG
jgi:hypothetical protein